MPISLTSRATPTIPHYDEDRDFLSSDLGKLIYVNNTADVTLNIPANFANLKDASIIIRNNSSSAGIVTITNSEGVTVDVSAALGNIIPQGGIAELKRVAYSNHWILFGYIEA